MGAKHTFKLSPLGLSSLFIAFCSLPVLSLAQEWCPNPVFVDFDQLQAGSVVKEQFKSLGLTISAEDPLQIGKAILFDSSCPGGTCSGQDQDLGTPNANFGGPGQGTGPGAGVGNDKALGNLLIVAKNDLDQDLNGFIDDPNDSELGGRLIFDFDFEVIVGPLTLVDITGTEEAPATELRFFNGAQELSQSPLIATQLGDNSAQQITPPAVPVTKMEIRLGGSGGLPSISFCPPTNEPPTCILEPVESPLECTGDRTVVQLSAAPSFDPDSIRLSYGWETDCPGGQFNSAGSLAPFLSFDSVNSDNTAVSCQVSVTVSDGAASDSCSVMLNVAACPFDCNGKIAGEAQADICGVCNGDGLSCRDCFGVPFGAAVRDRCGICGGDGFSCLGCENRDVFANQFTLDGNALAFQSLVRRASRVLKKKIGKQRYVQRVRSQADVLYLKSWELIWSLPNIITSCESSEFCVSVSNVGILSEFVSQTEQFNELVEGIVSRLRKGGENDKLGKRFLNRAAEIMESNEAEMERVPVQTSNCS